MNRSLVFAALALAGLPPLAAPAAAASWVSPQAPIVVTMNAAPGDGGNAWGGHQTRIVRNADGVFTVFLVTGTGYNDKHWKLVRLDDNGLWQEIAEGSAGREPANLLTEPDGTLDIVAFPGGVPTLWRGRPTAGTPFVTEGIPGVEHGFFPYNAAGINDAGRLCAVVTNGGGVGGALDVACRRSTGSWNTRRTDTDFRFAYDYVFPTGKRGVTIVGTRDVVWEALGAEKPEGAFDYAFTAAGVYRTRRIGKNLTRVDQTEEPVTPGFPNPFLNAQMDAYVDRGGRIHVLYWRRGQSTGGIDQLRHRVVRKSGELVADVPLPDIGWFQRIFQDERGRFFVVGSGGYIQRLLPDGLTPYGQPVAIDLGGFEVEYSGMALAAPRTGTTRSSIVDIVFPTSNEVGWVYVRLDLH